MQFKSERLEFELANASHAKDLLPLWSNYEVTKYTMVKNITCIDDCVARIERQKGWGESAIGPYIIKENCQIIGYCGGRKNNKGEAEIFYHIDNKKWGYGLGTEIAKTLITIAFHDKS